MGMFEKLYMLLIAAAVLAGLAVGQIGGLSLYADSVILPLLIIMLFLTFLQIPLKEMKQSFFHRKFTLVSTAINFLLTPMLAWGLAMVFLANHPALWLGFILLMVTPCTDWYIIFTGIAKGNVALSTSILPLNLMLQLFLLPVYLYLFTGTSGMVDYSLVLESILFVLFVPFLLAYLTRVLLFKKGREILIAKTRALPVLFLCFAIIAMFASQGGVLLEHASILANLVLPILIFFVLLFFIARFFGSRLHFSAADQASLHLTTLARNSPVALAIAVAAFPHEPLIAIVLIIGPLIELPVLAFVSYVIQKGNE